MTATIGKAGTRSVGRLSPRRGRGWVRIDENEHYSAWQRRLLRVLSSLADMEMPDDDSVVGPTWLVSVSVGANRRPTNQEVMRVLRDFRMPRPFDEDNHQPGRIRAFFCPVDEAHRAACQCKADEDLVVEPDGFRWTNPVGAGADPTKCRGCELEGVLGWPCPLHSLAPRVPPRSPR